MDVDYKLISFSFCSIVDHSNIIYHLTTAISGEDLINDSRNHYDFNNTIINTSNVEFLNLLEKGEEKNMTFQRNNNKIFIPPKGSLTIATFEHDLEVLNVHFLVNRKVKLREQKKIDLIKMSVPYCSIKKLFKYFVGRIG